MEMLAGEREMYTHVLLVRWYVRMSIASTNLAVHATRECQSYSISTGIKFGIKY
jgi:hypothetical protein